MSQASFLHSIFIASKEKSSTLRLGVYGICGVLALFNCYLYEQVFYELTIDSVNSVNRPYEWLVIIPGVIFSGLFVPVYVCFSRSRVKNYRKLIFCFLVIVPTAFVGLVGFTNISLYLGTFLHVPVSVQKSDAIVVINKGGFPFRGRLAAQLYHKGLADKMVVFVREIPVNTSFLQDELQVPEEAVIWARGKVNNTYIEAVTTRRLIEQYGWKDILVVTDSFQMFRVLQTFKQQGIQNMHPVSVPWKDLVASPARLLGWRYRSVWDVPLAELDDSTRYLFRHRLTIKILHEYTGILFYALRGYL